MGEELTQKQIDNFPTPDGYILVPDPERIERERLDAERLELERLVSETREPSNEELINLGKMYHPYYENLRRLNNL